MVEGGRLKGGNKLTFLQTMKFRTESLRRGTGAIGEKGSEAKRRSSKEVGGEQLHVE